MGRSATGRKKKTAVKLSTHFLVPRLRKSGAVLLLHLYELMTRARKTCTLLRIVTVIKLSQGCAVFVFALSFSLLRDLVESHRRGVDVIHVRCRNSGAERHVITRGSPRLPVSNPLPCPQGQILGEVFLSPSGSARSPRQARCYSTYYF